MISAEKRDGDLYFLEVSEIGANHRAMLLPNQDAISSLCIGENFVLAVADGVGSCQKADLGAKAAVEACVTTFEHIVNRTVCFDNAIMAKTLLNKFFTMYKDVKTPEKHLNNYHEKFILQDKKVKYIDNGKKKPGRAIGINKENLALIIEAKDGKQISISSPSGVIIPKKI